VDKFRGEKTSFYHSKKKGCHMDPADARAIHKGAQIGRKQILGSPKKENLGMKDEARKKEKKKHGMTILTGIVLKWKRPGKGDGRSWGKEDSQTCASLRQTPCGEDTQKGKNLNRKFRRVEADEPAKTSVIKAGGPG